MFDFLKNPDSIPTEFLEQAYEKLKEYCDEQGVDVLEFVKDPGNIPEASSHIYKQLPFALKFMFKENKIADLISDNLEFIQNKAEEFKNKPKM
jgi:hypothetical protein